MAIGFIRRLDPHPRRKYGYSARFDKVIVNQEGHPLNGIMLEGGIAHIRNKNVEQDFTGFGKRRREGVDIDFLISVQPDYIKELAK